MKWQISLWITIRRKFLTLEGKSLISLRNPHRYLDYALSKWQHKDARPIFKFKMITLAETDKLISSLHNSQAYGHDGLDATAFKSARPHLLRPVQHLVNLSLGKSICAMKWKFSVISPRLKSREMDRFDISSYRPVACLTTTSKFVERCAQQQILQFMETTQQLNASCHAYRRFSSTTTTLNDIFDELFQGIEEKKVSSTMAIDQTAAFDCVDKELLLQKLTKYNIGTDARDWIDNYLDESHAICQDWDCKVKYVIG